MWRTPSPLSHSSHSTHSSPESPWGSVVYKRKYPGLQGQFEDVSDHNDYLSVLHLPSLDEELWWQGLTDEEQIEILEHEAEMAKENAERLKKRFKAKFGMRKTSRKTKKSVKKPRKSLKKSRKVRKSKRLSRKM